MKEVLNYLFELAEQRIDDIVVGVELNNEDYKSIRTKASETEKQILKTQEIQNKFLEYEELNSQKELQVRREIYKKGFLDGIKISKLVQEYLA